MKKSTKITISFIMGATAWILLLSGIGVFLYKGNLDLMQIFLQLFLAVMVLLLLFEGIYTFLRKRK